MKVHISVALSALALAACISAHAQLAVSANDGKQPLLGTIPTSHTADNVAVIDLNHFPPKILGSVDVPASMIEPARRRCRCPQWQLRADFRRTKIQPGRLQQVCARRHGLGN